MNAAVPGQHRVLIVDDEPANIHSLAEALGRDYDLRFATDARRALELAASTAFDLILLDVVMPGMDGFDVLRRLKGDEATRAVPVIFVTSMGEIADEELGFTLGAVDYITKPVSAPLVRARVRTHIELKRQRDLLERRALIDELTGIANRRRFDEELERRWQRALCDRGRLGLIMVDVDHFKQFNDHYGHGAGDDCLRQVAATLAAVYSRESDLAARVGGEEFAVLMPAGDGPDRVRRLLQAIRTIAIPHARCSTGPWLSVSAGAVETEPQPGGVPKDLVEAADRLLYAAKTAGRNRCVHLDMISGMRQTISVESGTA